MVAILDHGLGNLFSVRQACSVVGLDAVITSDKAQIQNADAVILPGVGAFGQAMHTLHRLDLVNVLRDLADSGQPLIGICLGLQLLMSESYEFGCHKGLDIIQGSVRRFDGPKTGERMLKVPHTGWNRIHLSGSVDSWSGTLLEGIAPEAYMYFVHSYIVEPEDQDVILGRSRYGDIDFCSAVQQKNVCAFQFHPERSGPGGIHMYQNLAAHLKAGNKGVPS
ncbi:hypothetical protein JY97_00940 [Alkalispirochaeta odontotermitis]|nr:hypothetical protein JY97_00940 [Alkalispirochaeta odontotermitis]